MDSRQPYLPGPYLLEDTFIEKVRTLPLGGKILVETGQTVEPDTVIAHLNPGGYLHFVNVARELDVPFHLAAECVVKAEGETVRRGEILAARPAALGLLLAECRSPADGVVERIYPSGHVTVRSYPIPVSAHVRGRVTEVVPGDRVVIVTAGTLLQGVFGLGGKRHGPLFVLPPGREPLEDIPAGSVVVTGGTAGPELIEACLRRGAAALVAASCRWRDLPRPGRGRPAAPGPGPGRETGDSLTLVLTEGFGPATMTEPLFETLAGLHGREASVNGFTQLRAGVERPEVIVPHAEVAREMPAAAGLVAVRVGRRTRIWVDRGYRLPRLEVGSRVRLVRAPQAGLEGAVVGLPTRPERIATGAVLPVARVRLDDGREVTVPRCNIVTTGEAPAAGGRRNRAGGLGGGAE
ncbi:MAG: hypothetical protein AB1645_09015 [Bacillota bacterium]